tara:strand:- start:7774 stop:8490 length:717 start_codon:yes stop_codon:yes gene_type:complete
MPLTNDFNNEITSLYEKFKSGEHFAFSKFADGEFSILINQGLTNCDGWTFNPDEHSFYRKKLVESYQYVAKNYYIGIGCKCCMGDKYHEWMKRNSKQKEENMTWANIFVNSNYPIYEETFLKEYSNREIVMVVNENADLNELPFKVKKDFRIANIGGWISNYDVIEKVKEYVIKNSIEEHTFLFCAGPLGDILSMELHKLSNKNTYLDVGSTLDKYMGLGTTRGYLRGAPTLKQKCIW